ncbi:cellulase family glycosylhydrolase [Streptomyces beihaiensis]|uniref:Cellulase family glycosylhydrolase n=1 Tax=Streptomyces beihaiensis TaxID=2984495 RepID=A0ABT3TMT1_9ACTN|nr:cellulase family glycosylhydrolase [Streptomyces beihaiensis]MCX3058307.1 cellulase family glycosylhydrolase [Streptomyces beihaiensis]
MSAFAPPRAASHEPVHGFHVHEESDDTDDRKAPNMNGRSRARSAHRRPRLRLRLLVGMLLTLIAAAGTAGTPALAGTSANSGVDAGARTGAQAVVAAMQPSWNLGNTLDAIPNETAWGNPLTTKAVFDAVKASGYRSVRIPVTWSNAQATTAPYTIDPAYMARVKQVVDWAIEDGLYVDLNVHHDSWQWIKNITTADHDAVLARFDSTWRQIAAAFRNESRRLLFESVNEPQFSANATDAQKTRAMDELNTSFHTIVRQSGGRNATRVLLLPDQNTSPIDQRKMTDLYRTITALNDPNVGATMHYYSFWPFSMNNGGYTTFDKTVQQDLVTAFTQMHDLFVAKGIPVYLGEYGLLDYPQYDLPSQVERGEVLKYFEELGYEARINGVTTALWDTGLLLDRKTFQWRDPGLTALIRASWHTRSGTASTDQVFLPKSTPVAAHTVTLNTNGLSFKGLWRGDTRLCPGTDYTVSGDKLTLTPALLTRLGGDRAYGENATIEARFSRGVPWKLHVITNGLPVQSDATGTTSSLTIPTRFKGDVLATMESRYADGSNAGPYSWTPYQEFDTTFVPDYRKNTIRLTSDYLKSLTDGATVTLKFDFWSGASVTYHVTRSGDTVTGTVS